jgi:hypothetical protein
MSSYHQRLPHQVSPGLLAIAPKGTRHTIRNTSSTQPLSFLVVEVQTPCAAGTHEPAFIELATQARACDALFPVRVGKERVQPLVARLTCTTTLEQHGERSPWSRYHPVSMERSTR